MQPTPPFPLPPSSVGLWEMSPQPTALGTRWPETMHKPVTSDRDQWLVRATVPKSRGNQISLKWCLAHRSHFITMELIDNFLCTTQPENVNSKLHDSPVCWAYHPHFTDEDAEAYISVDLAQAASSRSRI